MSNILIINAHHHYSFAEGKLNGTLVQMADELLTAKGHQTRIVEVDKGWDVDQELENHQWADIVILQTPVNWMGVPWTFKKYVDEVYTTGMGGALCNGDGRTEDAPKANYGTGGTLAGKKYLISLTFNAPKEAFDDPNEYLFRGKSVDDLLFPMHMNFRFFAMEPLETFACYDVMKNPQVEDDFQRFTQHLDAHIPG
ncbi:NAD(P)H-dependent oxidoreductase [Marinobacter pelagius]|uniref:NAD(P)H-dependent oxidoreductase n=1 Tax=Marinobacter sp. C7 TaxID=2951363 RepID=UPI001EF0F838|nr:NAD(P)H-dependent oxidoreductase [Marinobacter sp. C7]MCG7198721.1 NAD(P)H-dependent oxidoreductase [Marinobacter sp. C7]